MNFSIGPASLDILGIGFGPAAIALATAIDDLREANTVASDLRVQFYEKRSNSAWHPDFILEDTDINHHFLRDLATPRDPRSRYTFANYLKTTGRLYDFGLLRRSPSRKDWSQYIAWVAGQLCDYVIYGDPAATIQPVYAGGEIREFEILTQRHSLRARNVVLSTGAEPYIPDLFQPLLGTNIFHTSNFLSRIQNLPRDTKRFLVVGGGQSAGEAILYLRSQFPDASITGVQRSSGFKLYDLGHFSNQVYSPEETEYFHNLPASKKAHAYADTVRTNYSGLDFEASAALFGRIYEDRVADLHRIRLLTRHEIVAARVEAGTATCELADVYTGEAQAVDADVVVLATGYRVPPIPRLLEGLRDFLVTNTAGELVVNRDYSVALNRPGPGRVFLNGLCERSHGIGEGQSFSMLALRAETILRAVLDTPDASLHRSGLGKGDDQWNPHNSSSMDTASPVTLTRSPFF